MKFRRLLAYMVVVASTAIGMRAEDVQQVQQLWQRWSVKNNLIYDATLTPNLGVIRVSGMKLADKPKKAGLYIHNGRKILLSPYDF